MRSVSRFYIWDFQYIHHHYWWGSSQISLHSQNSYTTHLIVNCVELFVRRSRYTFWPSREGCTYLCRTSTRLISLPQRDGSYEFVMYVNFGLYPHALAYKCLWVAKNARWDIERSRWRARCWASSHECSITPSSRDTLRFPDPPRIVSHYLIRIRNARCTPTCP